MDTNQCTVNTHLMNGTTSRALRPSSEDINEEEELEMDNLKSVAEEPISNYSSIHKDTFCDSNMEYPMER